MSFSQVNKVYVFHEYGAPEHYLGLSRYARSTGQRVEFITFTFFKLFAKAVMQKRFDKVGKLMNDWLFFVSCLLFPNRMKSCVLVIGCAPLDWRMLLLLRISKHAKVIYHSSWSDWSGNKYPKKAKWLSGFVENAWYRFLHDSVERFALVTEQVTKELVVHQQVDQALCTEVYHAFDDNLFYPTADNSQYKHIIFVGRLVEEKGVLLLSELARNIPEYRFSIVGSGRLKPAVEAMAATYSNISYLGFVKDREQLADLYRSADYILQPSLRSPDWEELFGIALIEAMACGVIPLATDHVGPCSILSNTCLEGNLFTEAEFMEQVTHFLFSVEQSPRAFCFQRDAAIQIAAEYQQDSIAKRWQQLVESL
ncbi:glycosyltransferase family 4 protein [Marinomonas sp.]